MNTALVALELRKNRLTWIGLAAAFVLVPPLSFVTGPRAGLSPAAALESGLLLWTMAGLPLAAAILGAVAGAGLREAAVRDAEAPLPGSPAGRVLRGLLGAAIQFALLALATAAISAAASPAWRSAAFGAGEAPQVWAMVSPLRGLFAFLCAELLAGSFLAAYALGHAFAGGLIGSLLGLVEALGLALGLQHPVFFAFRSPSFTPLAVLAAAAGLAAKAAAVAPLASRFERSRALGAARAAGAALLVAGGLLAAWGAEESSYASLRSSLRLLKPGLSSFFLTLGPSRDEAEAALNPAVRGAGGLATTVAGGLFWIAPDGRLVRLLPDGEAGRFGIVGPFLEDVAAAVWDADGRLLVERRLNSAAPGARPLSKFWAGRPEKGLRPADPALGTPEQIVREGGEAGIRFRQGAATRFCTLDDDGRARKCSPSRTGWFEIRSFEPQNLPLAAHVSKDGRTLSRPGPRARTWRLPGKAEDLGSSPADVMAYLLDGKPAYFVLVRLGDDEAVAVCRDDGRVETRWRHSWSGVRGIGGLRLDVLPDGSLVYDYAYDWSVADPHGTFLPVIKSKRLFERWPRPAGAPYVTPRLVRRTGGHAWILYEGTRLVELEESTGMPVKDWPLPVNAAHAANVDGLQVLSGGLVLQTLGSPFFVGWDGSARALRAP